MRPDGRKAGEDAAESALAQLKKKPSAAIVVASAIFNQKEMLAGIAETLPANTPLVGCTTAGEIVPSGPQEHSVAVLLMQSDVVSFTSVKAEGISRNMRDGGKVLGKALQETAGDGLKGAFVFSDGLSGNGTELIRGILSELGMMFPFVGGAAGDDGAMKKTYQYHDGEVFSDAAVGLGLSGDVTFVVGARSGWKPVGVPYTITKAKGQLLQELDGKPAFSIYEDAFGKEKAQAYRKPLSFECITHPLGMKVAGEQEIMIRAPIQFGDDGSMMLGAEAIEGAEIYLMVGTVKDAQDAVELTAKELKEKYGKEFPRLVFVSECLTRKPFFGEKLYEEFSLLNSVLGNNIPVFGFFSYGQFAPFVTAKDRDINACDPGFYEQSVSIALIG